MTNELTSSRFGPDPVNQFRQWFQDAEQTGIALPNAMTLATCGGDHIPSARIVLLKEVDERGFVFFTNYESRKGQDLQENPFAALLFYWPELSRQVRISGRVQLLEEEESDRYFAVRPRGHQLAAHASPQSRVISGPAELAQRFQATEQKYGGDIVPRPRHWGGYRVIPDSLEFWQERESRLHDRLRYRRDTEHNWTLEYLAP